MNLHFRKVFIISAAIVFLGVSALIFMPRFAAAEAGSGGGGGSSGCSRWSYSTCYGAVWRYYTTSSNTDTIPSVSGGATTVSGCATAGGYFAYVLVNKNGGSGVRAWSIGPTDGDPDTRSSFFGGQTNYRVYSNPSDPIPLNPNPGDYSWYSVEKAFAQTKALGQNNSYEWNGDSTLGWFCYRGTDFHLTPSISTNPNNAVTAGGTVTATGVVSNAGPTPSTDVEWRMSQFTVPSGNPPAGGQSSQDPVAFFARGTTTVDSGTGAFPLGPTSYPRLVTIADLPIGTKVCFAMSVRPYDQSTSNWYHSNPSCVVVSKRPMVQILGGDLRVGVAFAGSLTPSASNIQTSVTIKSGKSYGSWGEYGLIASGTITGTASGSAYSNGLPCTTGCAINNMSFANETSTIGKYTPTTNIPDVASSFAVTGSTPQFSSLADASLQRVETSSTDITITGGTLQKGQWLVINAPTKTVTIIGDINYANTPLAGIGDIPQLVIIANQINIEGSVKNIDAWLIASGSTGTVNTCTKSGATTITTATKLTKDLCQNPLVINGPVMAKKLYLLRTAGADTAAQIGIPAEVINLRPDAYLWGTYQSTKSARLETTYTQELPPRF